MANVKWKLILTYTQVTDLSEQKIEKTRAALAKGEYAHAMLLFYSANDKFLCMTEYSPRKATETLSHNPEPGRNAHAAHYFNCGNGPSVSYGLVMEEGTVAVIGGSVADLGSNVEAYYREFVAAVGKADCTKRYPYDCKGYCIFVINKFSGKNILDGSSSSTS